MTAQTIFTNKRIVPIIAICSCLLWASATPVVKVGYGLLSLDADNVSGILIFAGYRHIISGLLLIAFALVVSGRKAFVMSKHNLVQLLWLSAIITFLQYALFYIGLAHTSAANGTIANATNVFFSAILAHMFYKNDHLTKVGIIGILLGFSGVVVANIHIGDTGAHMTFIGDGLLVLSAFCWALGGVYGKKLSEQMDPLVMTASYLLIGGLMIAITGFGMGGSLHGFTVASTSLLVYLGMVSGVSFAMFSFMYRYNKVSKISIYILSIPVFGVIMSGLILGENIWQVKYLLALLLVYLGIWLVRRNNV
jgi:drug/metabolite transporter (DMT)-like permease